MSHEFTQTVLVVDDEQAVADAYARKLQREYETEVAYGGQQALEAAGNHLAAVLLDRRMPDIHGDDVLGRFRERGYEFPVIMVTAVDPDLNILEMAFDDYLCKPVDTDVLLSTLSQHIEPPTANPRLAEFFELLSKLSVLESELSPQQLEESEEFARTRRRAVELRTELEASMDDFEEVVDTYQSLERGSGRSL